MTCLISKGRVEPCKDKLGGIFKVFFANYGVLTGATVDSDSGLTAIDEAVDVYQYELKGTSTFTQSMTTSRENGTTMATQTLVLNLKGLSVESNKEIKLLAYGRPHIFVQDNNGATWLMGYNFGSEVTTADSTIGAGLGDAYNYTLTITAIEPEFAPGVNGATLALPFGAITVQPTITVGV